MKQDTPRPQVRDTRNGDWFWVNKLVLNHPYLTSSAKVVYGALAYFADNKTQKSFPSFETLSQLTHLKRITVIKAVRQLEDYYFIKTQKMLLMKWFLWFREDGLNVYKKVSLIASCKGSRPVSRRIFLILKYPKRFRQILTGSRF